MMTILPMMALTASLSAGAPAPGTPALGAARAATRLDHLVARTEPALRRRGIDAALSRYGAALGASTRRGVTTARLTAGVRGIAATQPSGRAHKAYSDPVTRR